MSSESLAEMLSPRNERAVKYAAAGLVGVGVNEAALFLSVTYFGLSYVIGGFIGVSVSIVINYAINDAWAWREYGNHGWKPWIWRGVKYMGTRVIGIGIHMIALIVFVEFVGLHYLIANLLAIAVGFIWGFGASDTLVWETTDTTYLKSTGDRWHQISTVIDRPTAYVLAFSSLLFVFFTTYTILLYRGYWMTGGDFGSYVHAFESTRQGIGFMDTGRYRAGNPTNSYWGEHFSVTLFLAYPLYWLVPTQETLLIIKSLTLSLSIPLLWLVAREHLSSRLAGVFVLLYGLNPFFHSAWVFDFQEQIFLPALLFGAYYFYLTNSYRTFLLLITAALLTNEFVVFIAAGAMFGLAIAAYRSPDREFYIEWPVFASVFAIIILIHLLAGFVISQFNYFTGIPVNVIAEPFQPLVETRRVGIGDLLVLLVQEPVLLWEALATDGLVKIAFFTLFLVPVAFLGLFDEVTLGSFVPYLGFAWIFAGNEVYYMFGAHYPLYLLPFLYIGSVRVAGRLSSISESHNYLTRIFIAILILSALGTVGAGLDRQAVPEKPDHDKTLAKSIEHVPDGETVITQNDIYPHFADRPNTRFIASSQTFREYEMVHETTRPTYILLDTEIDSRPEHWDTELKDAFGDALIEEYGLYRYESGVWLFKRGYNGDIKGITTEYQQPSHTYTVADLNPDEGVLYNDKIESNVGVERSTVWFGPYEMFPPGIYNVTFTVSVNSVDETPVTRLEVVGGPDQKRLAEKTVDETDGYEEITLTVYFDSVTDKVEFRGVRTSKNGSISIQHIDIKPHNKSASPPTCFTRSDRSPTEYAPCIQRL